MISLLILEAGWKRGFAGTFHASSLPTFPACHYLGEVPAEGLQQTQEFCDFFPQSIDCVCVGPSGACLSHGILSRPSGSRSSGGLGRSRLYHHFGVERAATRRRLAARVGAGGRGRRGGARGWIGLLDRTSRQARDPQLLAAEKLPAPDRAERGLLSSLGRASGVLCAIRAADQGLRADHGGQSIGISTPRFFPVHLPRDCLTPRTPTPGRGLRHST